MTKRNFDRLFTWTFLLLLLATLAGCESANDVVGPDGELAGPDVAAAALVVSVTGPEADASGLMIVDLLNILSPSASPAATGGVSAAFVPMTCASTFDLGNGITGTCSISGEDAATFGYGGNLMIDGADVAVNGTLVATPAAAQPETGSGFSIDLDATASGPRGTATWDASGTVTLDDAGAVVDFALTMTHTVTPTGGETFSVSIILNPSLFELILVGPLGGTVDIVLDRATMTGSVYLNGFEVATLTIADGCTTTVSTIPGLEDTTACAGS